jgi:beta-1,4-mannosyl-glycoprotein beta-1,4-N-acetylglucosaminyltransferase
LELRLKYLYPVVDHFIIVESNKTFQGNDKPYHLGNNAERFQQWEDKIIHLQIEQDPSVFEFRDVNKYDPNNGPFQMESQNRLGLHYANDQISDDDIVLISDVDEIWNRKLAPSFNKHLTAYSTISFHMEFFAYQFNNKNIYGPDVNWFGTVATKGFTWKSVPPQYFRDNRHSGNIMSPGGWHFSWAGNIKNKIQSFAHVEFNRPEIIDGIDEAVSKGVDVLQRPGVVYERVELDHFPTDLANIMLDYPHLLQ